MPRTLLPLALCSLVAPLAARGDDDLAAYAPFAKCDKVFVGKLTVVKGGLDTTSDPFTPLTDGPISKFRYQFAPVESLRGVKPSGREVYEFKVRGEKSPHFVDKVYVVGVQKKGDEWRVAAILPDDEAARKGVAKVLNVPAGWTWEGGKAVSPWASLGAKAWPKDGPKLADATCSKCGRPAALLADGIAVSVERVPAKNPERGRNDRLGDGTFKITVTNTTKTDVTVPAVLTDGTEVLWADSILFLSAGEPLLLPTAGRVTKDSKPLALKALEGVSGEVNSLLLDGVEWPSGFGPISLDIAVGERVMNARFHNFPLIHDKLRADALAELKK